MNSKLQQLAQYIQQQQKQGRSEDVIRNELEQSGWPKSDIDNAFQFIWQQTAVVTPTNDAALPPPADNLSAMPKPSGKGFKVLLIVALVLIVLLVAMMILLPKLTKSSGTQNNKQTQNTTSTSNGTASSQATDEQNSDNNRRDSDASAVAQAVSEYQNDNLGQLPLTVTKGDQSDTVKLCADTCTTGTTHEAVLSIYTYDKISMKSYSSGLAKPSLKELFIVNGAVCNNDKTWIAAPGEQQSASRAAAFLYAKQAGSTTKYSCADL